MIPNTLHILHLNKRVDRYNSLQIQLQEQGIEDVVYFEGIVNKHNRKMGISQGFKSIVQYAKDNNLPFIHIAEDDIKFLAPKAWDYYLSQIPKEYDIFWSMVFVGDINEDNKIVSTCSGMTLLTVNSRFYDFFLNINEDAHIDRELTSYWKEFDFKVCPLIPCSQSGSRSDNNFKSCDYSPLLEGRRLFEG